MAEDGSTTWGDWAKTLGVGGADVAAGIAGGARYLAEKSPDTDLGQFVAAGSQYLQSKLGTLRDETVEGMTPRMQGLLSAELLSDEWWEAPFSSTLAKTARSTPSIAASLAATVLAPEFLPAIAAIGAASGGLSAGQTLDEIYSQIDQKSDAELRKADDYYAGLRAQGMDEAEARARYTDLALGNKPAMLFAIGALTGAIGPEGQVARAIGVKGAGEAATGGLLGRTAKGAGVGAGGEFVQSGAEDITSQGTMVDAGLQDKIDFGRSLLAAAEGGLIGGVMGGAADAAGGRRAPEAPAAPVAAPTPQVAPAAQPAPVAPVAPVTPVAPAAQPAPVAPVAPVTPVAPVAVPPKQTKKTKSPKSATPAVVADANVLTPEESAALTAATPAPVTPVGNPIDTPTAPVVDSNLTVGDLDAVSRSPVVGATPSGDPATLNIAPATGATPSLTPTSEVGQGPVVPGAIDTPTSATQQPARPPSGSTSIPPEVEAASQRLSQAVATPRSEVPTSPDTTRMLPSDVQAASDKLRNAADKVAPDAVAVGPGTSSRSAVDPVTTPEKATPRILMSKADLERGAAFAGENSRIVRENLKAMEKEEAGPQGKKRSKAEVQKRAEDAAAAESLFNENAPETDVIPTSKPQKAALQARLQKISDTADALEINVPTKVGYEGTSNHIIYLREVKQLLKAFGQKSGASNEQITAFLLREKAARAGDFEMMRAERKAEGDAAKRGAQADVDTLAAEQKADEDDKGEQTEETKHAKATSGNDGDFDAVATKASKSSLGARLDDGTEIDDDGNVRARAASPVRSVSDELKAQYAAKYNTPGKATPEVTEPPKATKAKSVSTAAKQVDTKPTEAQKEAGNYRKGHVKVAGLDIAIETPKGAKRSGTDPFGNEWETTMPAHYGYVKRTTGADGDQVDVYLGPSKNPGDQLVYVVDQIYPNGGFDEHKAMVGFDTLAGAMKAYEGAFSDGSGLARVGDVRPMGMDAFKAWLKGDTTKPAGDLNVAAEAVTPEVTAPPIADPGARALADRLAVLADTYTDPPGRNTAWGRTLKSGAQSARRHVDAAEQGDFEPFDSAASKMSGARYALGNYDLTDPSVPPQVREFGRLGEALEQRLDDLMSRHESQPVAVPDLNLEPRLRVAEDPYWDQAEEAQPADPLGNDFYAPVRQTTVGALLKEIDLDTDANDYTSRVVQQFARKRLYEVASNVEVHVVSDADLRKILRYDASEAVPHGLYARRADGSEIIFIRAGTMADPKEGAVTLLHEATHAGTMKMMEADKEFRTTIEHMMNETLGQITAFEHVLNMNAFKDVYEFVAEAFSNPDFQDALTRVDVSPELAARLKMDQTSRVSVWDAFITKLRRMFGIPPEGHSMLEAAIRATDMAMRPRTTSMARAGQLQRVSNQTFAARPQNIVQQVKSLVERPDMQEQQGVSKLMRLQTLDYIARQADRFFGSNNPVRTISNLLEKRRVRAEQIMQANVALTEKFYQLQKKYTASGEWEKFAGLMVDETSLNVFADQPLAAQTHLGKNAMKGWQGKGQHARLHAAWNALPADLKAARAEAFAHYTDLQNQKILGLTNNIVEFVTGKRDDALAQRVFSDTMTPADEVLLADVLDQLKDAQEFTKISGPYLPLSRYGDYVVNATSKVTPPPAGQATQVEPNVFDFTDRKQAEAYVASQQLNAVAKVRWIDSTTGLDYIVDINGKQYKVTANDANAVQTYRVTVQDQHTQFFDSEREARIAAAELEASGMDVRGVQDKRVEPQGLHVDMQSRQMARFAGALDKRTSLSKFTPQQVAEMKASMRQLSIEMLGSTRLQSSQLQRKYVQGASRDMTRVLWDYTQRSAGYLAKLETAPAMETAMKALREGVDNQNYDKTTTQARSRIANEVESRVWSNDSYQDSGPFSKGIRRLLSVSFIDKLASPAYSMVNALQTAMVSAPVMAGRHGLGRTAGAISKAYRDIGAGGIVAAGAKSTWGKAARPSVEGQNFIEGVLAQPGITAAEKAMFARLVEHGRIDPEAGLEVSKLIKTRDASSLTGRAMSAVDTGIGYAEGIARQMPKAIETINRTGTALAAYRLERSKGASHEAAMHYAEDVVAQTHFIYSNTNAPSLLNHPLARLAFQFKKFGMGMYQLLGEQVGKAIHNTNPGDRAEAVKTLTYIAGIHVLMAGTIGLPTEPLKGLVIGLNLAGLTEISWEDVEDAERKAAADIFGTTVGEMVTRGVTRGLPGGFAFDLSSRVGLDNMMVFGSPETNETNDVFRWFAEQAAGAPAGLLRDWHKGVNKIVAGDFVAGAESLLPLKVLADSVKAYRTLTEGKTDKRGRQTMEPYGVAEAAVRAVGFTPGREAEAGDKRSSFYRQTQRQKGARNDYLTQWLNATPNERAKLWGTIERWNKGREKEARLTRADLDKYVKSQKTAAKKGTFKRGLYVPKQNKGKATEVENIFND